MCLVGCWHCSTHHRTGRLYRVCFHTACKGSKGSGLQFSECPCIKKILIIVNRQLCNSQQACVTTSSSQHSDRQKQTYKQKWIQKVEKPSGSCGICVPKLTFLCVERFVAFAQIERCKLALYVSWEKPIHIRTVHIPAFSPMLYLALKQQHAYARRWHISRTWTNTLGWGVLPNTYICACQLCDKNLLVACLCTCASCDGVKGRALWFWCPCVW